MEQGEQRKDGEEQSKGDTEQDDAYRCSGKVVTGFLVLIGLIAGGVYLGLTHKHELGEYWQYFLDWCKSLGWMASVVVAFATWLCVSMGLPGSGFFVGSAAVFSSLYGPNLGAIVAIASCGIGFWAGCVTAFVIGRQFLRPMMQRKLDESKALKAVNEIISEEGWKFAFLMRLSPLMPVEVFNFACALTNMSFRDNTLACFGSLPVASFEIWMYAQVASAVKRHSSSHASSGSESEKRKLLIALVINVPIILMIVAVVRHANRKYHEKVEAAAKTDSRRDILRRRLTVHQSFSEANARSWGVVEAVSWGAGTLQRRTTGSFSSSGNLPLNQRPARRSETEPGPPPCGTIKQPLLSV